MKNTILFLRAGSEPSAFIELLWGSVNIHALRKRIPVIIQALSLLITAGVSLIKGISRDARRYLTFP